MFKYTILKKRNSRKNYIPFSYYTIKLVKNLRNDFISYKYKKNYILNFKKVFYLLKKFLIFFNYVLFFLNKKNLKRVNLSTIFLKLIFLYTYNQSSDDLNKYMKKNHLILGFYNLDKFDSNLYKLYHYPIICSKFNQEFLFSILWNISKKKLEKN